MMWKVNKGCTGGWSSGMIPVSGTGGPGFNSRTAPIFVPPTHSLAHHTTFLYYAHQPTLFIVISSNRFIIASIAIIQIIKTDMHSITLDSTEAEEIIKLRVDLARTKNKLIKYEEFISKMDQFDQQINYLL